MASIASYANNAWTVFNNIVSGEEQSEINHSAFLALQDFIDLAKQNKILNGANALVRIGVVGDRFYENYQKYQSYTTDKKYPDYDNGKVPFSVVADMIADSAIIIGEISKFAKFNPIGMVVGLLSLFYTEVSNSLNTLKK